MLAQSKYLVKVEAGENNNKFYRMTPDGDSFTVEYGRIGNSGTQTMTYNIGEWDRIYKSKIKKGYIDNTHLVSEVVIDGKVKSKYLEIDNTSIAEIVKRLQVLAKQAIADNYTISSNKVTKQMIDEAQSILNSMQVSSVEEFNEKLLNLFRAIPRKMARVSDNLAKTKDDFSKIVQKEQDLLDTMKGQVVQQSIVEENDGQEDDRKTILDALGIEFSDINQKDELLIREQLGSIRDRFHKAWVVTNKKTQKVFDKYVSENKIKNKKLLWHGSRNENWWSIVNTGLLLRPNAVITGKMFGDGIYFAPKAKKSLGYTSINGSYWVKGNSSSAFMSLYDSAYGIPYDVYFHSNGVGSFNYDRLQKTMSGANCLHAHEGQLLRNDEIVFYKEEQVTIKYLVELT